MKFRKGLLPLLIPIVLPMSWRVQADPLQVQLTPQTLVNWSIHSSYDLSMKGKGFYDHSSYDNDGDYLNEIKVDLSDGTKLILYSHEFSDDTSYTDKTSRQVVLQDVKSNKIIWDICPTGLGICPYHRRINVTAADVLDSGFHEITHWEEILVEATDVE